MVDLEQDLLARIETVCRNFKVALQAGGRPRIEDALGAGPDSEHPLLLRELLTLELVHRRESGETPDPGEYRTRFPGRDVVIQDAFDASSPTALARTPNGSTVMSEPRSELITADRSAPPAPAGLFSMADLEILGELGGGGQGVVYRAYDQKRGQVVALKVLPRASPSALYRFKQEFRTLAGVTHPNLVTLYELFSDGQQWSFTMELVDGVDLLTALRPDSTATATAAPNPQPDRDLGRLRGVFRQLAEGVAALHAAGHVHRDLKPSNVMVARSGRVVILDMGIAAELDRAGLHQSTEPHIIGTVSYMAPEQGQGCAVSPASDWYSVGVMLYEALTGRLPFLGGTLDILMDKQRYDPPAPATLVPGIPDDLNALCVALLQRDPAARPADQAVLQRLGGEGTSGPRTRPAPRQGQGPGVPLIGRESDLKALRAAYQAMKQGRTVICSVHGRSGVGKTALIQHFLEELAAVDRAAEAEAEAVILAGRCFEQESVPYKAFDSLVDVLSRYLKRLPRWEVEALLPRDVQFLGRVFPVLRRVAAVGEAPHRGLDIPDPHELRQRAFTALRELLARLGDRKPLVLAIDDLQWADVDSAALLSDLLRPPDPPRFLLLACYRSEDTTTNLFLQALRVAGEREPTGSSWFGALDRRALAVEPLTPAQAGDLARALLDLGSERDDRAGAGAGSAEAIARESGGSPLFVAELVDYVRSGAVLPTIALDQVLWERVVRLPETAQRLLEVVAVSGQPITQTAACRAVALDQDERAALAVLRSGRLVRSAGQSDRDVLETYHDRVRETVVAHLPEEARQDCHRRLALALLDSGETDAETLAVHFHGAGQPGPASAYYARAADQAAETLAFDRAAKLYRLALELRPATPEAEAGSELERDHEVRRLRTKLGDALVNAGRGAEAAREYLAARQGAPVAEVLELERRAAMQFLISGYVDEGIAVLRTVLHAVGMTLPGPPRRAFPWLVLERLRLGLRLRIRGLAVHERDAGAVPPEELTRIDVCWAAVEGLSMVAPISAAIFQTRNLRLALRAGEPYRVARAVAMQAFHSSSAGGWSQARTARFLEAADALAQRVGHPHALGMAALASGVAAYCNGRWREACAALERAGEIFRSRCTGVAWELTTARLMTLPALVWMGEHTEAFRCLRLYRKEAQERGELYCLASVGAFGVHERLVADEPEQARSDLAEVMRVWSRQGYHMQHMEELWMESHIDLYRGDGDAAWDRMTRQWPALRSSLLMRVQVIRIGMHQLRARCALAKAIAVGASGDRDNSAARPLLAAAERNAKLLERERMLCSAALAHLIRAGVAAARGDRPGAVDQLNAAISGLAACDMNNLATVARRHLGELIGGAEGQALIAEVNSSMTAQKIRNPDRYSAMVAPGFRN
jgi:tetratricopeptide (TPR) repeat protein